MSSSSNEEAEVIKEQRITGSTRELNGTVKKHKRPLYLTWSIDIDEKNTSTEDGETDIQANNETIKNIVDLLLKITKLLNYDQDTQTDSTDEIFENMKLTVSISRNYCSVNFKYGTFQGELISPTRTHKLYTYIQGDMGILCREILQSKILDPDSVKIRAFDAVSSLLKMAGLEEDFEGKLKDEILYWEIAEFEAEQKIKIKRSQEEREKKRKHEEEEEERRRKEEEEMVKIIQREQEKQRERQRKLEEERSKERERQRKLEEEKRKKEEEERRVKEVMRIKKEQREILRGIKQKQREDMMVTLFKKYLLEQSNECPICYETLTVENLVFTPCLHNFCKDCFLPTVRQVTNRECAICRNFLNTCFEFKQNIIVKNLWNDQRKCFLFLENRFNYPDKFTKAIANELKEFDVEEKEDDDIVIHVEDDEEAAAYKKKQLAKYFSFVGITSDAYYKTLGMTTNN